MAPEEYIASIGLTAGLFAPINTALCQGQVTPVSQNTALFYLVGDTYGGDGQTTFALPDLRGSVPFGTGAQAGTPTTWNLGQRQANLTQFGWPGGEPAATTQGVPPTFPISSGPAGLALNWAITLYGVYPPRPS